MSDSEKEWGKDRYTAQESLSLIDKLSLCSGNPPINVLAQQCTQCMCVCVCMMEKRMC